MESNNKLYQSLHFVATFWRKDSFSVDNALKRLGIKNTLRNMRRRVATVVAVVAVLGMSAAIYFSYKESSPQPVPAEKGSPSVLPSESPLQRRVRMEFTDATLDEVVKEIEHAYGVKIENIPDEEIRLTLCYEGNASDLIATINELLGTHLKIKE